MFDFQCFGLFKRGFSAFYGVDYVLFDRRHALFRNVAVHRVHLRRTNERTVFLRNQLHALCRRIRALIELTGKIFHREYLRAF